MTQRPIHRAPQLRLLSLAILRIAHLRRTAPLALGTALVAHAQAQQEPLATTLPPVIVTAKPAPRLDQAASTGSNLGLSPLQTPASLEVIDREQLESRGDASLIGAITRSTGITTLGHPGNSGASLASRGFTDAASVMRLYDGTRQYGAVAASFPFDTWSVERIEVLRGPASVIHGDGAVGGVINVVPKKPTRGEIRHEVQARVATQGGRGLAFGSGGAASDTLSYRLDLSGARSDGWVDRGDNSNRSVAGAVQLDLSPDLNARLSHAQGLQKPMRYFGTPLMNGRQDPAIREKNYNVADSAMVFDDRWTELQVNWVPHHQLTARSRLYRITSERYWRNAERYVFNTGTGLIDRSDNTEIRHHQRQTGNTADLVYSTDAFGMPHQISAGFDINRSSFQHDNNTYTGTSPSVDPYHPEPGAFSSAAPFIPRYRNRADQYALFAEARSEITSAWSLITGLRRDHADVSRADLVAGGTAFERSFRSHGWRLGSVYLAKPELSVYAQYSKAADPVAGLLMLSPSNAGFDMSYGRQAEVGVKQSFWDRTAEWTLAAYRIVKNKLLTRDAANPAQRLQVGQRSSQGAEATLSLSATRTVRLDANLALLRARYDDFAESVGGVAISRNGNVPTDVPERVANLWASWKLDPRWTLSGGVRHVGKRYADNANTLVLPAYTLADAALQWQASAQTTLAVRGYNVFDRDHFTTAYYTNTQWFVGEGRRVELTLHHTF